MISYNPKDWLVFLFKLHRSDTLRRLAPALIGVAVYCALVVLVERNWLPLKETQHVKSITVLHGLLGFVISLLLVFRTNTAYDRWWEGRKLWGALVNNSRNLALKLAAILPKEDKEDRKFFEVMIAAYAVVLKNHLRGVSTMPELLADNITIEQVSTRNGHLPNRIAQMIFERVNSLYNKATIKGDQLIVLNAELLSFTDVCGACERIRNTPIPYSYSAFVKKFIFFYVITLPIGYVSALGYLVIPVVMFVFYVLASLELIAEEIEDPFGNDDNDLPLDKIAANIEKNVAELLA